MWLKQNTEKANYQASWNNVTLNYATTLWNVYGWDAHLTSLGMAKSTAFVLSLKKGGVQNRVQIVLSGSEVLSIQKWICWTWFAKYSNKFQSKVKLFKLGTETNYWKLQNFAIKIQTL